MRFRDIPQLTQSGQWECNFGIGQITNLIKEWREDYGLQLYPDFQRGHVWTEDQQIKFMEFLFRGGKLNPIFFNKPDWRKSTSGEYVDMVCVDGLQRLTAIMLFENDEIPVFGHRFSEFEDKPRLIYSIRINVNDLPTKADVLRWYIELNSGGTPHTEEEISRVIELLKLEEQ